MRSLPLTTTSKSSKAARLLESPGASIRHVATSACHYSVAADTATWRRWQNSYGQSSNSTWASRTEQS